MYVSLLKLPDLAVKVPSLIPYISASMESITTGKFLKFSTFLLPLFFSQNSKILALACALSASFASKALGLLTSPLNPLTNFFSGFLESLVSNSNSVSFDAIFTNASAPLEVPWSLPTTPRSSANFTALSPPLWNIISSMSLITFSPFLLIVSGLNSLIVITVRLAFADAK